MDTLKPGEQRLHNHPVVGQFCVRRWFGDDNPKGLPYFTAGHFYATETDAVRGFDTMTREGAALKDRRYAMAEASIGEVE